jgi:hypothetical protein
MKKPKGKTCKRHSEISQNLSDHETGWIQAKEGKADCEKLCDHKGSNKKNLKEGYREFALRPEMELFFMKEHERY